MTHVGGKVKEGRRSDPQVYDTTKSSGGSRKASRYPALQIRPVAEGRDVSSDACGSLRAVEGRDVPSDTCGSSWVAERRTNPRQTTVADATVTQEPRVVLPESRVSDTDDPDAESSAGIASREGQRRRYTGPAQRLQSKSPP